MLLHEFMTAHRREILEACHSELQRAEHSEPLVQYAADFFDETVRALRRDAGMLESESPLPQSSEAAARFGEERQRAGLPITQVPILFAAFSQALATTGESYELTISAEEYKRLNRCLDAGVATSIEKFWHRDKHREVTLVTEQFGFMAHELRNALSNANLAFKLVQTGNLDIRGRTADVVARNLAKMEALVTQCLSDVQLKAGVAPDLVPLRVSSVLRNLENAALPDRSIVIQLSLDDQLFIMADELLLSSAIGNLLHNAVKFSAPASTIRLAMQASGDSVSIEVEDQCGGLEPESAARIFEPFVKERSSNQKGSGLGLAISRRAVEAMGGNLSFSNVPGHGCIFRATFPLLTR
ncbi:MAG: HAMP domain-containing sensor histidine kinase [Pseudomonadota bacterium]